MELEQLLHCVFSSLEILEQAGPMDFVGVLHPALVSFLRAGSLPGTQYCHWAFPRSIRDWIGQRCSRVMVIAGQLP